MKKFFIALGIVLALVVFVLLFCIYLRPNHIISKAEAKARFSVPESKFIHWRGAEIHYTDTGRGPAILMIHGFGGNFTNFSDLAHIMQDSFRVIRVDLPGFGLSDMPELSEPQKSYIFMYRNFISFLIDNLHLDSVYVVGNSMGGWLSWEMAIQRPDKVKKLVLLNSAGYDTKLVKKNAGMTNVLSNPLIQKIAQRGYPMFMSQHIAHRIRAEDEDVAMDEIVINNGIGNRQGNLQNLIALGTAKEEPDTTRVPKVPCPTLIFWGKEDPIIPYRDALKFRRDIRQSSLITYDHCGHVPMMEYPEQVASDIKKFLKK